jgi:predicted nucleic acid-binding protein
MQQQFPLAAEKFIDSILNDSQPAISVVTEIELLCWETPTDNDLEVLHHFIADALVLELEQDIKIKTAELRKARKIKLPDAIIAATALTYNLTLLSRNVSDFKSVDGLNLINPHEQ